MPYDQYCKCLKGVGEEIRAKLRKRGAMTKEDV